MTDMEFSRHTAELFFSKYDPIRDLRNFRNFIPEHVLKSFCGSGDPNMWVMYEENQMHFVGDEELLTLFQPEKQDFEKKHWSHCFGSADIYASYFDNLTPQAFHVNGFSKFLSLQRVDREIHNQLADPIWQIHGNQSLGEIPFQRDDINIFRKFLYLMSSLGNRERNMHLLAHHEFMENARLRRRKFIDNNELEHARDVWLRNVERILDTHHQQVPNMTSIFDLDRADYKANAVERYMVFWEAAPGDEFILTDSAFGGFEGGQIGAKKNSQIDMTPLELEQHLYTRDFMWHQIYVLSPTLAVALCHPTLMHPELTKLQRKRWGLRKSLLESLPHDLPSRYYKDMKKGDMSFSREGWHVPVEVEKVFSQGNGRGYDRRRDEDIVFPVHRLTSGEISLVNSVLLHNQELGPKIKAVCVRPPPSYQCFHQSLLQFQHDPWPKYSEEPQNDYMPLLRRLEEYLNATLPPTPPNLPSNYAYHPSSHSHQASMYDSRPSFGNMQYGDVSRYDEPPHFDSGRPVQLQAHSSTQSSLTSSFAPSSQSSYSYSSASSQSSGSTKTTSIDAPQFEHRQKGGNYDRSLTSGSVHRSNTSGKSTRSKSDKAKTLNIVIEKTLQEEAKSLGVMNGHYGYQAAPTRGRRLGGQPPSGPPSKRSSPNPPIPPPHTSLPDKKNYATDNGRLNLPHRARTDPQHSPVVQYVVDLQPPQRRSNRSSEDRNGIRYEQLPQATPRGADLLPDPSAPMVDSRGRRYEPVQPERNMTDRGRPHDRSTQQQQMIDSVRERLHQVINSEAQPQPTQPSRNTNRSPERKVYQMVAPTQPPTRVTPLSTQQIQPTALAPTQSQSQPVAVPPPQQQLPPQQGFPSSRNTSTEHSMRPGVQIVRGRSQGAAAPPAEKVESKSKPQGALVAVPYHEYEGPAPQNPVVKQLRFETPTKSISHKYSDLSLAGSMLVQVGDSPMPAHQQQMLDEDEDEDESESESDEENSEYDDNSEEEEEEEEEGDDDESWEDEGPADPQSMAVITATTAATTRKNRTRTVRFADKPLPSPRLLPLMPKNVNAMFEKALLRKGLEIERPNSRLGRRVEIPRPLSRNGQARFETRKATATASNIRHVIPPYNRRV